jgi:adenosylcobinamide kinase / adenosylcobinamide-phosphate guanylyltransferase
VAEPFVLVLGGTRSGKSRFALELVRALAGEGRAWFIATAWPGDPELDRRIARHRADRPAGWPTVDAGVDLAGALARTNEDEPVLIEGLTLWLSAMTGDRPPQIEAILDGPVADGLRAIAAHRGPVVVVSDELGLGMVPMDPIAREFRDLAGLVHQRFAAAADEVQLVVAGLPMTLKARMR